MTVSLVTERRRTERDPFSVDRGELRAAIAEWQREVYPEASDEDQGGGLRVLVLRRVGTRRDAQLLSAAVKDDSTAEALAARIASVAERYADNTAPGYHVALEVCAFYGSETIPRVTHHMGVRGHEDEDDEGGRSIGSRPADIVRHMAQHSASTMHAAERKDARATGTVMDALDRAYHRIETLEGQVVRLFDSNMRLADSSADREAKLILARASADMKREAGKLALGLAPTIVNRMAGQQILPEGLHPIMVQLSALAMDLAEDEALSADVFGSLARHGPKGQRLARTIGELMASVASINAAAEQAARIGKEQAEGKASDAAVSVVAPPPAASAPPPASRGRLT